MGRTDFLSHGYTDTLGLALDANTDLETGSDLIAAARKFSETYCKECNGNRLPLPVLCAQTQLPSAARGCSGGRMSRSSNEQVVE